MAIVLNGTTGITNDGGYTGDGVSFADTTPANTLVTDTSGSVGIGIANPLSKLHINGATTRPIIQATNTAGNADISYVSTNRNYVVGLNTGGAAGEFAFYDNTAGAERMRIDSSGNLLINTTSLYDGGGKLTVNQAGVAWAQSINHTNATNQYFIQFNYNSAQIGRIEGNNTNASYLTTSDYRLKEDIAPMTGALEKVSALKPVTYKWKVDGSYGQGFIAHELQEVVPDAVSGEKDAVETVDEFGEDGKVIGTKEVPKYQGIDTSFLVATLTAAIQELKATVDAQAARIAALENPPAPTPVES